MAAAGDAAGLATRDAVARVFEGPAVQARASVDPVGAGDFTRPESSLGRPRGRYSRFSSPPPGAPKTSFKRSLKVGFLAAVIPLVISGVAINVAESLGYVLHPNYDLENNVELGVGALGSLMLAAVVSVFAPVSEEIIFRGGVMGGLQRLTRGLGAKAAFWIPAVLSSSLFVVIHETADPLLMATRFMTYMVWSYAFHKEGILSTMAAHGFSNGLMVVPIVASAFLGTALGGLVAGAASLAMLPAAIWAWRSLKAEKPKIDSGEIAPKPFDAKAAWVSLAILAVGMLLLPNFVWAAAIAGLIFYLTLKK
jgi:membrane protease YdiL (CAAX protease family)